jgi:hypothetical protein
MRVVRADWSGAGPSVALRTQRCPTQTSVGGHLPIPARVSVREPAGPDPHLFAYAPSLGEVLPAPARWECTAGVGVDGNEEIAAGPIGSLVEGQEGFPEVRPNGPAVRATLVPACAGCIAEAICSFFPGSRIVKTYESLQSCDGEPPGEVRRRLSASTFLFADPPGVHGVAAGSGGRLAVIGVLSFAPDAGLRQVSCALPAAEFSRCAAVLVAFIDLGRRS